MRAEKTAARMEKGEQTNEGPDEGIMNVSEGS